jgi:DNA (cytosine-5)-methyltransferase 1
VSKPRVLDLFCGAGGCSVGYAQAGFEVVGVDIEPQPNYPFEFWCGDALVMLDILLRGGGLQAALYNRGWDAIHASPPCQAYTKAEKLMGGDHPDLVAATRELLEATGLPYVIENVKGAPLFNPQLLEGQMFGLNTHRPRLFETNWGYRAPVMRPPPPRQAKMGRRPKPGEAIQVVGHFSDVAAAREAMGIPWMNQGELAQAIPPAYTEAIGTALLTHLNTQKAAA